MKILMITSNDGAGGYWQDLLTGLTARGHTVGLFLTSSADIPSWLTANRDIEFFPGGSLRECFKSFKKIRKKSFDLLQSHLYIGTAISTFLSQFLKVPHIVTRHYLDENWKTGKFRHRMIDKIILFLADSILTHSHATRNWIVAKERARFSKIYVVHQGFDFTRVTSGITPVRLVRNDLGLKNSEIGIFTLARFTPSKGYLYLINAAKICYKQNKNLKFHLFGIGDSNWLNQIIYKNGMEEVCKIHEASTNPYSLINAADIIVHPSLADSFSQIICEALIIGKPLVATNVAAASEQIIDGNTGLIVPPHDAESLAHAIIFLAENHEVRDLLSACAKQFARENFNQDSMLDGLEAIYKDVINR